MTHNTEKGWGIVIFIIISGFAIYSANAWQKEQRLRESETGFLRASLDTASLDRDRLLHVLQDVIEDDRPPNAEVVWVRISDIADRAEDPGRWIMWRYALPVVSLPARGFACRGRVDVQRNGAVGDIP